MFCKKKSSGTIANQKLFRNLCDHFAIILILDISDVGTCPAPVVPANSTDDDNDNGGYKFDWDTETQSMVLGCFFYGYVVTQMPGGTLGKKHAPKNKTSSH